MTDEELEQMLRDEFAAAAPGDFDAVLAKCRQAGWQEAEAAAPENQTKRPISRRIKRIAALAAMLVLLVGGGFFGYRTMTVPTDVIQLDVNPSIELALNTYGRVVSCKPVNTDAVPVLGKFDLRNKSLGAAVGKLTTELMKSGYITPEKNAVLIAYMGEDGDRAEKLLSCARDAAAKAAADRKLSAAVLTQAVSPSDELTAAAQKLGLSQSKTALVQSLGALLPGYDADAVAALTTTELAQLALFHEDVDNALSIQGAPYCEKYISGDKALAIADKALAAAGKKADTDKAILGVSGSVLAYYVTASDGGKGLTYIINAVTGDVIQGVTGIIAKAASAALPPSSAAPSGTKATPAPNTTPKLPVIPSVIPTSIPTAVPSYIPIPSTIPATATDVHDHDHED